MIHDSMHLNPNMLAAPAQSKAPLRSPLAQHHNFAFAEDFLQAQADPAAKQGEMPYEKPQNAYLHEQQPDGNCGDFRGRNLDTDFSRHFN